ncbi:MAG: iron donor protein CyaY [Alphaproteobacteria bacterium]|nr:iron donor protein CyaY [Alphaproteobacteria bacterium]
MHLSDAEFETLVERVLERWLDAIEDAELAPLEAELQNGILTVRAEGAGTFIVNKHMPLKQLWYSSPYSGASHYVFEPVSRLWRNTREGQDLAGLFGAELSRAGGGRVALD